MLMSLSLCLPPWHGGRAAEAGGGRALVQSPAGGAPPALPAAPGSGSGSGPGGRPVKVLAPLSASREDACFFRRGGGTGAAFLPGAAAFSRVLQPAVCGAPGGASGPDSRGLARRLCAAGGGGRGGGDRGGLWEPLAAAGAPRSWLCTCRKSGLTKHSAPWVWLHSSSEGVLGLMACTPLMRQSWRQEAGQRPSERGGLWGGGGLGGLLSAEELQKSESHYQ